ncbi:MAG: Outer membrane protein assembly factor BamB [Phycisphaerae bacterium]|nr:Outer membrane protein assembly factor BamB [Phycisphaerae bacterium]
MQIDLARDLRWKVAVPVAGNSSPIVWGDRIFLTGEGERVLAFDRRSGDLVWNVKLDAPEKLLPDEEPGEGEGDAAEASQYEDTGTAAPTACTDGQRVYVFYGSAVLGAMNVDGKSQAWCDRLTDKPDSTYGLAVSPVFYDGVVYVQLDEGKDETLSPSNLYAYRGSDGKQLWRKVRSVSSSWTTPLIVAGDGRAELITTSRPWAIAYALPGGDELWRGGEMDGDVAASPVAAGNRIFAASGEGGDLLALDAGGSGDVSKTHTAWTARRPPVPDVASPVTDGRVVVLLGARGIVTALNVSDGRQRWQRKDFADLFWASPVCVGSRVYAIDKQGTLCVFAMDDGRALADPVKLDEATVASPAFVGRYIYVRTAGHLLCIGPPGPADAPKP